MPIINCAICGKEKYHSTSRIASGNGKFCSRACSWASHLGKKSPKSGNRIPRTEEWKKLIGDRTRGKKRPITATRPMHDALKKARVKNPQKYLNISMRNLPKGRSSENHPSWKGGLTAINRD